MNTILNIKKSNEIISRNTKKALKEKIETKAIKNYKTRKYNNKNKNKNKIELQNIVIDVKNRFVYYENEIKKLKNEINKQNEEMCEYLDEIGRLNNKIIELQQLLSMFGLN